MTDASPSRGTTGNYFELTYADLPSFGKAPHADLAELSGAEVAVYGVPWDATASPKAGARLGPRRIREESQLFHEIWNPGDAPMASVGADRARTRERISMVDCGDVTIYPFDIEKTRASVHKVAATVSTEAFPIALGGDHYIMYPAYQGVCDALPDTTVGVVQIDAHDDTVADDPVLGEHWCGSPIQRAVEYASLDPRAVAMVGLRNFIGEKQLDRHRDERFVVIPMEQARELGARDLAERAIRSVCRHCDVVYLTVDIDAVDPSCAPGCSSPSPGGFLGHEFMALMRELGRHQEVIALDLVEVAPPIDPTEQTPAFAAHALFHFIEARFLRS